MKNVRSICFYSLAFVVLTCMMLTLSNPSLASYRKAILSVVAEQEALLQAQRERNAVEKEAVSLQSYFSAAHYDGSRLDVATIQRRFPTLGRLIVTQAAPASSSLNERLIHIKEQALQRIAVTHETALYSLKADLAAHSMRISYGLWSTFSTCHNSRLISYLGIAGQFYEDAQGTCFSG